MSLEHYNSLSKLFDYPEDDYYDAIANAIVSLKDDYPEAKIYLEKFVELLPLQLSEVQELYSKSFEVQAVTSLDVGYVLYGDDYQRGIILVKLNQEHKKVNNDCGVELGDFLPNLLRLLTKIEDDDVKNEMVTMLIAPSVEKMINEYQPTMLVEKDKLYKKQYKTLIIPSYSITIFGNILQALYAVFESDFTLLKNNKPFKDESFIGHIRGELEIQEGKQSSNSCDTGGCSTGSC
jgi:nitrate reductase assembly molybdenum cofactor insertion protein NarJ